MDAQREIAAPHKLFIDGKLVAASDGGTFEVTDPATERSLTAVANATVEDAEAAVAAAAGALPAWAALAPRARAEILRRTFELIVAQQEPLARPITRENGKSTAALSPIRQRPSVGSSSRASAARAGTKA